MGLIISIMEQYVGFCTVCETNFVVASYEVLDDAECP